MLQELLKQQFITTVLRPVNYNEQLGHRSFSVMVVDKAALEVISSCMGLNEVFEEGVTLVEDLTKNREPMPSMPAIYIMLPTIESIDILINDFTIKSRFQPANAYKEAHVFFLEPVDDNIMLKVAKSAALRFIKTFKEIDANFKAIESQIFTTHSHAQGKMAKIADGIVGLCVTLKINPLLRYHSDFPQSSEICYRVDERLKACDSNGMRSDAELIVLERSFDLVSPLLHEMTLQAMASDLTDFQNGVYKYIINHEEKKEITMDESDSIWIDIRHKHLSTVMSTVPQLTKELGQLERSDQARTAKEVQSKIRQLPAHLKKKGKIAAYINLVEECRDNYFKSLENIILLEQDMAVGHTSDGDKLTDSQAISRISTFIVPEIPTETRLRLILIFMLTIGKDKDDQFFNHLLRHTDIAESEFKIIKNMLNWRNTTRASHPRKPLSQEERFASSRWEPNISSLVQEIQEKRLDEREFNVLGNKPTLVSRHAQSARYGSGLAGRPREKRKIIIFIIGGITFSEIRIAYEMSKKTNTTIILGSDSILTPSKFLKTLR